MGWFNHEPETLRKLFLLPQKMAYKNRRNRRLLGLGKPKHGNHVGQGSSKVEMFWRIHGLVDVLFVFVQLHPQKFNMEPKKSRFGRCLSFSHG